jgi:hypothetical protein
MIRDIFARQRPQRQPPSHRENPHFTSCQRYTRDEESSRHGMNFVKPTNINETGNLQYAICNLQFAMCKSVSVEQPLEILINYKNDGTNSNEQIQSKIFDPYLQSGDV